jgi:hypothetical protein
LESEAFSMVSFDDFISCNSTGRLRLARVSRACSLEVAGRGLHVNAGRRSSSGVLRYDILRGLLYMALGSDVPKSEEASESGSDFP